MTNHSVSVTNMLARINKLTTEIANLQRETREGAAAISLQEETVQRLGKQMADFRSNMMMGYDFYGEWHNSVHNFGEAAENLNEMLLRKDKLPGMIAEYERELRALTSDLNGVLSETQSYILQNYQLPTR